MRGSPIVSVVLLLALWIHSASNVARASDAPVQSISVGSFPWDVATVDSGDRALVSNANAVEVVDLNSGRVTSRIGMIRPRQISVSPQDGLAGAIVGEDRTAIAIFDFNTSRVIRSVGIPGDLQDIQYSADGSEIFVSTGGFGKFGFVHRIDAFNLQTKSTLPVREWPTDLTLGPDGSTLYISCTGTDGILAWDLQTPDQVKTITTRPGPKSIVFSPDGRTGYVSYAYNPGISVVDRDTSSVMEELVMPRRFYADNSAVNPKSGDFYLAGILVDFAAVDPAKGRIVGDVTFNGLKDGFVRSLAVTPDGQEAVVLLGDSDGVYGAGELRILGLPLAVPSQPRNVQVRTAGSSGVVEWAAPKKVGTTQVDRYRVRVTPGKAECETKSKSCRIKGLKQGVPYSVTVQARNDAGWGKAASARGYRPSTVRGVAIQDSQPVAGRPTQVLW